jgi:hypothetical protein
MVPKLPEESFKFGVQTLMLGKQLGRLAVENFRALEQSFWHAGYTTRNTPGMQRT